MNRRKSFTQAMAADDVAYLETRLWRFLAHRGENPANDKDRRLGHRHNDILAIRAAVDLSFCRESGFPQPDQ
jgi:hypothetical protein